MKRAFLAAAALLISGHAFAIGLRVGMTGAAKKKLSELEANVAAQRQTAYLIGVAAHGNPIAASNVTIKDCAGSVKIASTSANGNYALDDSGIAYPAMLSVPFGAGRMYGIAFGAGTSNLHPLTDMVLRTFYRSAKGLTDMDARFDANFLSLCGLPTSDGIAPLKAAVTNMLAPVLVRDGLDPKSYDPFTTSFAADGTGFDKALDETSISTNSSFSSITIKDLTTNAVLAAVTPGLNDNSTPLPPTLLAGTPTSSTVTLTWVASPSANLAGYGVYRDGNRIAVSTINYFTEAGLPPGTAFKYTVSAITWTGNASAPAALTVTTLEPLTVTKLGLAGGTVTSAPSGINCGASCGADFGLNTSVTLTAAPDATSIFLGWGGACSGTAACTTTMDSVKTVTARFFSTVLTVAKSGTGTGSVASAPAGISCGATCSLVFTANSQVTLTPAPDAGSVFTSWSGSCAGSGACVVTMNDAKTVTAQFDLNTLTVSRTGSGSGSVASAPAGINCPTTCAANFNAGTPVTLTPTVSPGSVFTGWSGACSGTGACVVTMNAAQSVTARFDLNTLTVAAAGAGSGSVTSSPAGINCGATCSANFNAGTAVALSTVTSPGSVFTGWSGACTGTGPCSVTMNGAASVTATFALNTLTVSNTGLGSGSVVSAPAGISCGGTCSANFTLGAPVTLTPTAGSGSIFGAWGGACAGSGACVVTMNGPQSVTARFDVTNVLTVAASGSGTVGSSPAGISCGATCSATYNSATTVTLTTFPAGGFAFSGWTGACTGTGQCNVPMTQAQSVTAHFLPLGFMAGAVNFTGPFPAAGTVYFKDAQTNSISTVTAYPGQVQVFFDTTTITPANAASALTSRGATILGQIPLLGIYLAQVAAGSENTLIAALNPLSYVRLAIPNVAELPADVVYLDKDYPMLNTPVPLFISPPTGAPGHPIGGPMVDVLDTGQHAQCVANGAATAGAAFDYTIDSARFTDAQGRISGFNLSAELIGIAAGESGGVTFVNMSRNGGFQVPVPNTIPQKMTWADVVSATPAQLAQAQNDWYVNIESKLQAIAALPPDLRNNTVFVNSAGNNNMDIEPMLMRLRLNPTYKQILDKNMLIVGTNLHIDPNASPNFPTGVFSNHAAPGDPDVVNCDNAEANTCMGGGTSFASPACLAMIRQMVAGGTSAPLALQAVKRAGMAATNKQLTLAGGTAAAQARPFTATYSCQVTGVSNCSLTSDPDAPDADDGSAPSLANLPSNPIFGSLTNLPDCQASAQVRAAQDCNAQVSLSPDGDDLWACSVQTQTPIISNCVQQ